MRGIRSRPAIGKTGWRSRLGIWRDRRTLLIGLIVLGMAFAEGSANDWLALAMVDGHGVDNATGALVFGIFVTAMTVGRVVGVYLLDRFGRVPVLRVSAVLAGVGLVVVIFAPIAWLAGIGVVLWGLGSALGFPVGMSAAADDPRNAAARVSAVATIGYLAFLVGPPLVGFVGEHVGLLNALLMVLALVAVAGIVSPAARKPALTSARSRRSVTDPESFSATMMKPMNTFSSMVLVSAGPLELGVANGRITPQLLLDDRHDQRRPDAIGHRDAGHSRADRRRWPAARRRRPPATRAACRSRSSRDASRRAHRPPLRRTHARSRT